MTNIHTTLTILQYNTNKSRDRTQIPFLDNLNPRQHHIVAIQEPAMSPNTRTTCKSRGYHLLVMPNPLARVCFYVSKALPVQAWQEEHISLDLRTLTIRINHTTLHVHNIYNPNPSDRTQASPLPQLPALLQRRGEHILLGDFNLHHAWWAGSPYITQDREADTLINIVQAANLDLALPAGTTTWQRGQQKSTLDLVFVSNSLLDHIQQCQVWKAHEESSDHFPILTKLDFAPPRTGPTRRCYKNVDWQKFQATVQSSLATVHHAAICETTSAIDNQAALIQGILQQAMEMHVPYAKPSNYASRSWTPQCAALVKEARQARRRFTQSQAEEDYIAYRRACNAKKREIRRENTKSWRRFIAEATTKPEQLWKLAKWARHKAGRPAESPQMPPLRKTKESLPAHDNTAKAAILAERFFPQDLQADLTDILTEALPSAIQINRSVSREDVIEVARKLPPDKAPGPDQIPNRVIKACLELLANHLAHLFTACLQIGHHPTPFKHSTTVVVRKPDKDYSLPEAYRPIALLNTLGKVLERIVAERISSAAEEHHLLPDSQMGARRKRSTTTALAYLTEQIHTIWNRNPKFVASMLSLDLTGAYDRVSHPRLLSNLRKARMPEWVVTYIASFLTGRSTQLSFSGYQSAPIQTATTGIPQGSSLSPILFLFFAAGLLAMLRSPNASSFGFVDDTNILTFSNTTEQNCRILESLHEKCLLWAHQHGASFAPDKYKLIHFSRHTKHVNLRATIDIQGVRVAPVTKLRVLGIWVDNKLRWGPHIRIVEQRGKALVASLGRLSGSTWGANFARCRQIYTAVIRPTLTYGCRIWAAGEKEKPPPSSLLFPLEKVQNSALRAITGTYKRTPIAILEREADIEPLPLYIRGQAMTQAYSASDNQGEHTVKQACNTIWKTHRNRRGRARRRNLTPQEHLYLEASKVVTTFGQDHSETSSSQPHATGKHFHHWKQWHWKEKWEAYTSNPARRGHHMPALFTPWQTVIPKLHRNLSRPQSSLASLLRSGVAGFNDFLFKIKVPGVDSPSCPCCGWPTQHAKHVVIHCPAYGAGRQEMWHEAGTDDYNSMLQTEKGITACTRWALKQGILQQFHFAREMLNEEEEELEFVRITNNREAW